MRGSSCRITKENSVGQEKELRPQRLAGAGKNVGPRALEGWRWGHQWEL